MARVAEVWVAIVCGPSNRPGNKTKGPCYTQDYPVCCVNRVNVNIMIMMERYLNVSCLLLG